MPWRENWVEEMEVGGVTLGPLKVLVVDQTRNEGGFEHNTSDYVLGRLKADNVLVATTSVVHSSDTTKLTHALENHDFNVLLMFAHGKAGAPNGVASGEAGGICFGRSDFQPWQTYGNYLENLTDKVVVMCICEGMNFDAVWTLFQQKSVLTLVGSSSSITGRQAEDFLPEFFDSLNQSCTNQIPPETVESCVQDHNQLTGGIMSSRYGS